MKQIVKRVFFIVVFLFISFLNINTTNAFGSIYTDVVTSNSRVILESDEVYLGQSGTTPLIGADGYFGESLSTSLTCTISNDYNISTRAGIAEILNKYSITTSGTDEDKKNYFCATYNINNYLYKTTGGNKGTFFSDSIYYLSSTSRECTDYYSDAVAAQNLASSELTATSSSTELSFYAGNDGYYYSNPVTISTNGVFASQVTLSNRKFLVKQVGENTYVFYIKIDDVSGTAAENLTATFIATRKMPLAAVYDCSSEGVSVTPNFTESTTVTSKSINITGTIIRRQVNLKIAKIDKNGDFVEGSELMLQPKVLKDQNKNGEIITTENGYNTITVSEAGTYYLSEVTAAPGYTKSTDVLEIVIDLDGNITVNGVPSDGTIKLLNSKTKTKISMVDASSGKKIAGATLQILDSKKNPIMTGDEILYKWVSTNESMIIEGLPVGTYYLKEVSAPNGYTLTNELIKFEVTEDGTVAEVVMKNSPIVSVENTANTISLILIGGGVLLLCVAVGIIIYVTKRRKNDNNKKEF